MIKHLLSCMHQSFFHHQFQGYYNRCFPKFAERATRIITVSEYSRKDIAESYNIDPEIIKKKPRTLKQIGDDLDLSKERIRQIELQALQKLRQSLSTEQFDLLTG